MGECKLFSRGGAETRRDGFDPANYSLSPRSPVRHVSHLGSISPKRAEINPEPTKSYGCLPFRSEPSILQSIVSFASLVYDIGPANDHRVEQSDAFLVFSVIG